MTWPKTQAVRIRDETICDLLERLCRARPLSHEESALLMKTLTRLGAKAANWRWTRNEDKAVQRFLARRREEPPRKPYTPNEEVRVLAARLGRSEMAVYRRMARLRARAAGREELFKREAANMPLESEAWTMNGTPQIR